MYILFVCFSFGISDVVCGWYEWSYILYCYYIMVLFFFSI